MYTPVAIRIILRLIQMDVVACDDTLVSNDEIRSIFGMLYVSIPFDRGSRYVDGVARMKEIMNVRTGYTFE